MRNPLFKKRANGFDTPATIRASVKIGQRRSKMGTGEMSREDVTREEYPAHFAIAEALGGTVEPFDVYQGPYIDTPYGRLFISMDGDFATVWNEENGNESNFFFYDHENEAVDAALSTIPNPPEVKPWGDWKREEESGGAQSQKPTPPKDKKIRKTPQFSEADKVHLRGLGVKGSVKAIKKAIANEEWGWYGSHLDFIVNHIEGSPYGSLDIVAPDKSESIRVHAIADFISSRNELKAKAQVRGVALDIPENMEIKGLPEMSNLSEEQKWRNPTREFSLGEIKFQSLPDSNEAWGWAANDVSASFFLPERTLKEGAVRLKTPDSSLVFNGLSAFFIMLDKAAALARSHGFDIMHYDDSWTELTPKDLDELRQMGIQSSYLNRRIAADYGGMFAQVVQASPNLKSKVDKEIEWAKRVLKKSNRIVWWLRWLRLSLIAGALASAPDNQALQALQARLVKETPDAASAPSNLTQLHQQLEHFYSLPVSAIQEFDPKSQPIEDVIDSFKAREKEWQESVKSTLTPQSEDEVFLDFNDGWAWWLLPRASCSDEATAMGHCGNAGQAERNDRTILSLRQKRMVGNVEKWEPHLTFILHTSGEEDSGYLGEMKGKGNNKPVARYHPYIVALLKDRRIKGIIGGGYLPSHNFAFDDLTEKQQQEVRAANPEGAFTFAEYLQKENVSLSEIAQRFRMEGDEFTLENGGKAVSIESWRSADEFVESNGDADAQALQGCIDGDMSYFADNLLSKISPYPPAFIGIGKQINAEFPHHRVDLDSSRIVEQVIESVKAIDDGGSSELRKGLEPAILLAYGYDSFDSLKSFMDACIKESPDRDGDVAGSITYGKYGSIIYYLTGAELLQLAQNRPEEEEDIDWGRPEVRGMGEELSYPQEALNALEGAFKVTNVNPRRLEDKGQERLFERPKTDEQAQREGFHVSSQKMSFLRGMGISGSKLALLKTASDRGFLQFDETRDRFRLTGTNGRLVPLVARVNRQLRRRHIPKDPKAHEAALRRIASTMGEITPRTMEASFVPINPKIAESTLTQFAKQAAKATHVLYDAGRASYTVRVMRGNDTIDEYNGGNSPFDSVSEFDRTDSDAIEYKRLLGFAEASAKEMAEEYGVPENMVQHDDDLMAEERENAGMEFTPDDSDELRQMGVKPDADVSEVKQRKKDVKKFDSKFLQGMGIRGARRRAGIQAAAVKPKCPHCGSGDYGLMPPDFETAKCDDCGKNWNHGIVKGINDPSKTAAHHREWWPYGRHKFKPPEDGSEFCKDCGYPADHKLHTPPPPSNPEEEVRKDAAKNCYKTPSRRGQNLITQNGAGRRMESSDGSRWAVSANRKRALPNHRYDSVEVWTLKRRDSNGRVEVVDINRDEEEAKKWVSGESKTATPHDQEAYADGQSDFFEPVENPHSIQPLRASHEKTATTYEVEKRGGSTWFIVGLPSEEGDWEQYPDTLIVPGLNHSLRTPEGLTQGIYEQLYDEFQVNDNLKAGDIFNTPVGRFICEGVHVLPYDDKAKAALKAVEEQYKCAECGCDQGDHRREDDGSDRYLECRIHPAECKEFKKTAKTAAQPPPPPPPAIVEEAYGIRPAMEFPLRVQAPAGVVKPALELQPLVSPRPSGRVKPAIDETLPEGKTDMYIDNPDGSYRKI